jgi:tetratricopeptide (TPR) repeat protein
MKLLPNRFLCNVLRIGLGIVLFQNLAEADNIDSPTNSEHMGKMHASPFVTENRIGMFELMETTNSVEAVKFLRNEMEKLPKEDPWICWCYYTIGMSCFKAHEYEKALQAFETSLRYPETTLGNHLSAQQMKMICLKSLGRFEEAANAAKLARTTAGPDDLREQIVPNGAYWEAQLREQADTGDGKQRALAEQVYRDIASDSNIVKSAKAEVLNQMAEAMVRDRIQNLIGLGRTNDAVQVAETFLKNNPKNYYSPLVALDLKRIQKARITLSVSELNDIAQHYDLDTGAGAHILYEMAVSETLEKHPQKAVEFADRIISLKPSPADPMPPSVSLVTGAVKVKVMALLQMGKTNEAEMSAASVDSNFVHQIEARISRMASAQNALAAANISSRTVHNAFWIRLLMLIFTITSVVILIVVARGKNQKQ